jgi:hypothetical protein
MTPDAQKPPVCGLAVVPGSAGFCMNCNHWKKRDAMQELGYVPIAAIGYCPLFNKFTEATHGIHCTAYSPNDSSSATSGASS